ncbi:psbP domain-containing protein 4, chloroplastic [Senna tora]|uniref:PsbP domain-containing protein 4, chloroplastic n=1 Tax=Senna tora TaxID=362788 RepID=A0A834WEU9_9FABA|nr:psbP domain-containing protein 4, chloroplastic [Senna tora]
MRGIMWELQRKVRQFQQSAETFWLHNGSIVNRNLISFRRIILASGVSLLGFPRESLAEVKQGLLAGRIPGLSEPDEQGWRTYRRPDDKSGGHGVGWSPIIPYKFSVPQDWVEVPVSIADLGGTEIDLRFASSKEGRLFVIVAPVLRFADNLGEDAKIEEIGPPDKVISAFGPEVIGENVEGKVLSSNVAEYDGRTYYQFELEPPHVLITATAAGNRLYLFSVTGSGLQWKRHYNDLKKIHNSFRVV